jgi:hypothetical protein
MERASALFSSLGETSEVTANTTDGVRFLLEEKRVSLVLFIETIKTEK